ncbi:hypothetical protein AURDEDRAFT_117778 [Auricularia subglabra TFB-10046 SS5]|uniref:Uncharacterized protein n=1 Tax=Auricularia subglabra (strain TFB-10046 / SS5) TaxID=717982 RepID=J0CUI6_AURST|nr:hypothetical protein AURDEDRAFT_117778 [Auricularia subglabra TFB-10046 SS5]
MLAVAAPGARRQDDRLIAKAPPIDVTRSGATPRTSPGSVRPGHAHSELLAARARPAHLLIPGSTGASTAEPDACKRLALWIVTHFAASRYYTECPSLWPCLACLHPLYR